MATPNLKIVRPTDESAGRQGNQSPPRVPGFFGHFKNEFKEGLLQEASHLAWFARSCLVGLIIYGVWSGYKYVDRQIGKIPGIERTTNAARGGDEFVAKSDANVRSGPGINHGVIDLCEKGCRVRRIEIENNAETVWFKVEILSGSRKGKEARSGWVAARYFEDP